MFVLCALKTANTKPHTHAHYRAAVLSFLTLEARGVGAQCLCRPPHATQRPAANCQRHLCDASRPPVWRSSLSPACHLCGQALFFVGWVVGNKKFCFCRTAEQALSLCNMDMCD